MKFDELTKGDEVIFTDIEEYSEPELVRYDESDDTIGNKVQLSYRGIIVEFEYQSDSGKYMVMEKYISRTRLDLLGEKWETQ